MSRDFQAQSDWTFDHQKGAVIGLPGVESDHSSDPECSEPQESCLELSKESVHSLCLSLFYTHPETQIHSLVLSVLSTAASENTL